jgi:hypothetical protein
VWRLARTRVLCRLAVSLVVCQTSDQCQRILRIMQQLRTNTRNSLFSCRDEACESRDNSDYTRCSRTPKTKKILKNAPATVIEKNWFRFKRLPRRFRKLPRSLLKLQEDSWTLLGSFQEASGSFLRRSMKLPRRSRKLSKRLSLRPSVYRPTAFRLRPGAALVCKISGQ